MPRERRNSSNNFTLSKEKNEERNFESGIKEKHEFSDTFST